MHAYIRQIRLLIYATVKILLFCDVSNIVCTKHYICFCFKILLFFHTNTLMHANDQIVASSPSCRHRFAAAVLLKSFLFSWMV